MDDDEIKVTDTIRVWRFNHNGWNLEWHKLHDGDRLHLFLEQRGVALPKCLPSEGKLNCHAVFNSPPNPSFEEAREWFKSYPDEP
jgi:hypothetical protein